MSEKLAKGARTADNLQVRQGDFPAEDSLKNPENLEKEITISVAVPEDAEEIQQLFYKTWLDTYPNKEAGITVDDIEERFKERISKEGIQKSRERLVNRPEGNTTLVAKESDNVIGVCRVAVSENENRLQAVYVLPDKQGKGIGTKLWEEAQKLFDPTKDTFVAVATYNTDTIEFYKKLGFEDTGKRWADEELRMKSGSIIPQMDMVIRGEKTQS